MNYDIVKNINPTEINDFLDNTDIDTIVELINKVDVLSTTFIKLLKVKVLQQTNPEVIYKMLTSDLVNWSKDPFKTNFYDGVSGCVEEDSILDQNDVNKLFYIYAIANKWYENIYYNLYVRSKEDLYNICYNKHIFPKKYVVLTDIIEEYSIDPRIIDEFFGENIPKTINCNTLTDLIFKSQYH